MNTNRNTSMITKNTGQSGMINKATNKTINKTMKLMVGMGSVDDYPSFVEAGADEIFVGYVPYSWTKSQGVKTPLNRREVLYYNVQIGSYSELLILRDMVEVYHVPVTIVMNSLSYKKETYPEILEIVKECQRAGFHRFIIADPNLLDYLQKYDRKKSKESRNYTNQETSQPSTIELIVSGEYGELNQEVLKQFEKMKVKRIIFPRQTTISEMKELISIYPNMEYEAFVLNEKCHYTGAYCNSMHCDEFCHMCKVPYVFTGNIDLSRNSNTDSLVESSADSYKKSHIAPDVDSDINLDIPGSTGCGLCALWKLRDAGVTHLKIVSRGNGSEATKDDLRVMKTALNILKESETEEEYICVMKSKIFPNGCSGSCYYMDS